ncbi:type I methionyl aminopeptidase [Candidatus Fermentibacteria bacterium]|nr:type I methionyl aminopeptidase [Candidatus Fermentibacteria bacterium]
MIKLKTTEEIDRMRRAGRLAARLLQHVSEHVTEGTSTEEIDRICDRFTESHGAQSAPYGYRGFPKHVCTSVNDVVCHGIPSEKDVLSRGDIVNVDVTVRLDGYHGDTSRTFMIGEVDRDAELLVRRTEKAMYRGIDAVRPGKYLYEVGKAVERYLSKFGYGIVRAFSGHGIGRSFHEEPMVFHHYSRANKIRLRPGMTFTVEPMINMGGSHEVTVSSEDGWTVRTKDGSLSAQFEHTVLVTEEGVEILTSLEREQ